MAFLFSIAGASLAKTEEDFPIFVRIKNTQKNVLRLALISEAKVAEVAPGKEFELTILHGQKWRVQYASGIYGTSKWNYDQSIPLKKCIESAEHYLQDELYLCDLQFVKDPATTTPVASGYKINVTKMHDLKLDKAFYRRFYTQFFPEGQRVEGELKAGLSDFLHRVSEAAVSTGSQSLRQLRDDITTFEGRLQTKSSEREVQKILVFGDQGTGKDQAKQVARNMYAVCFLMGCDYAISAGDNIYPRGPSINNHGWQNEFVNKFVHIYNEIWEKFGFPFYMTLGNHDIGVEDFLLTGDWVYSFSPKLGPEHYATLRKPLINAQVGFTNDNGNLRHNGVKMWNMEGETYSKLIDHNGLKTFIVSLDTNYYPGALQDQETPYNTIQADWLKNQLESEDAVHADWRIVFGHHPLYSAGRHGVNIGKGIGESDVKAMHELREALKPVLCNHNVNFYIVGHDHHLEMDRISCENNQSVVQVLSGAASKEDTAQWHEKGLGIILGPNAFSSKLVSGMDSFIWANGLSKQEIIDGDKVEKKLGFSHIKLHKDYAEVQMIQSTKRGPEWFQSWMFSRNRESMKELCAPDANQDLCKSWSGLFKAP